MVISLSKIVFTFSTKEYEADRGMTWTEWIASDYNTIGSLIKAAYGYVWYNDYGVLLNGEDVYAADTIVPGALYTVSNK